MGLPIDDIGFDLSINGLHQPCASYDSAGLSDTDHVSCNGQKSHSVNSGVTEMQSNCKPLQYKEHSTELIGPDLTADVTKYHETDGLQIMAIEDSYSRQFEASNWEENNMDNLSENKARDGRESNSKKQKSSL